MRYNLPNFDHKSFISTSKTIFKKLCNSHFSSKLSNIFARFDKKKLDIKFNCNIYENYTQKYEKNTSNRTNIEIREFFNGFLWFYAGFFGLWECFGEY